MFALCGVQVTMAGYECGSLNFPAPPYPDQILCPEQEAGAEGVVVAGVVTVWAILAKVIYD